MSMCECQTVVFVSTEPLVCSSSSYRRSIASEANLDGEHTNPPNRGFGGAEYTVGLPVSSSIANEANIDSDDHGRVAWPHFRIHDQRGKGLKEVELGATVNL
jgi:hypothetical protein